MRNYSRQVTGTYKKYQSLPRNYSQQKRLQQLHTLKDSEVKVGIYKYSTEEELGKGYSSKVYKGVEIERIHKRYAIKVIELKKFRGSSLEMLEAEIEIHRQLVHESVLRLYEVIKTPYFYYLVLEYCPHGSLHDYIKQKKKLNLKQTIQIMEQIIGGYKYLAEVGVIHRDMKPANILRIGNKWKISDFGFAVKSRYGFKDRINVGTPLYMAPEALKKSYYSTKGDIFALGIILYEMLYGKTPWESSHQKELLQRMKEEVELPKSLKDERVRQFITQACQTNQNQRMTREQLMEFEIRPAQPQSQLESQSSNHKTVNEFSLAVSRAQTKRSTLIDTHPQDEQVRYNQDALKGQFCYARHLHSCLSNVDSFLFESETRQVFILMVFKLLLRVMRCLCDKQDNPLFLKHWEQYRNSKAYLEIYNEMAKSEEEFEKEYLEHIKHNDIKIIRTVNKKFPELSHQGTIANSFYENLIIYLVPLIREQNHSILELLITADEVAQEQTKQAQGEGSPELSEFKHEDINEIVAPSVASSNHIRRKDSLRENRNSGSRAAKQSEPGSATARKTEIVVDVPLWNNKVYSEMKKQSSGLKENPLNQSAKHLQKSQAVSETPRPPIPATLADKIQALESLYAIFRLSELRSQPDHRDIQTQPIKVVENYAESQLTRQDYLDLRRLIRGV